MIFGKLRDAHRILRARNDREVRDAARNHARLQRSDAAGEKIRERLAWLIDAERRVQVRAAEIEIDRHDVVAETRERDRETRGDERFTDAALAAADRPHLLHLGRRPRGARRSE